MRQSELNSFLHKKENILISDRILVPRHITKRSWKDEVYYTIEESRTIYDQVSSSKIINRNGTGVKITDDRVFNFSIVLNHNLDCAKYYYKMSYNNFSRMRINYDISGANITSNTIMFKYRLYPGFYPSSVSATPLLNTK